MYKLDFSAIAEQELNDLRSRGPASEFKKLLRILEEISQTPYGKGLGKPEPLKHNFSGWWSRQISGRYRIIYQVASSDTVRIARCKYDYHKSS